MISWVSPGQNSLTQTDFFSLLDVSLPVAPHRDALTWLILSVFTLSVFTLSVFFQKPLMKKITSRKFKSTGMVSSGPHTGARPGVGARRRVPGGLVFAQQTRQGAARPKRIVRVCWERLAEPSVREVFNSHLQESLTRSRGRLGTLSPNGLCYVLHFHCWHSCPELWP